MCDFEYFEIENTVEEWRSNINGRFATLDQAKKALNELLVWYTPHAAGTIYRHQFTINPDGTVTHEKTKVYSP